MEGLLDTLWKILDIRTEYYKTKRVIMTEIDFRVKDGSMPGIKFNSTVDKLFITKKPDVRLISQTHKMFNYNIPLNTYYLTWGTVKYSEINLDILEDKENSRVYHINYYENHNVIQIKSNNKLILEFSDRAVHMDMQPNMSYQFIRTINSTEFFIQNGEVVHKTIKFKPPVLKTIKKNKKKINKFLTLDMETRVIDNKHVPYCICIYDLNKKKRRIILYY